MLQYALYTYTPSYWWKYATNDEIMTTNFILQFKDGYAHAQRMAAEIVGKALSAKDRSDVVFMPIPASSKLSSDRRYKFFSSRVCQICGAVNGYEMMEMQGSRTALHMTKSRTRKRDKLRVTFKRCLKGMKIILFDDIVTSSKTMMAFAKMLTDMGAIIIGALFLSKTRGFSKYK